MQCVKIIPDTNVIVSASILENIEEVGIIKHKFYDQYIQLFSIFKKQNSDIEGIAIPQVKSECFRVLSRAIKNTFVSSRSNLDNILKEKFYDNIFGITNSSEYKMMVLLTLLKKIKLDTNAISENLKDVVSMSEELEDNYNKYQKKQWRQQESKQRAKSITT